MKHSYDSAVEMFNLKHPNLFYSDGSRSKGNSISYFFWMGFDHKKGERINVAKNTLGYAYFRAGEDCNKKEIV